MKIIGLKNINKQELFELFSQIQPIELDKALEKEFKNEKDKEKELITEEKFNEIISEFLYKDEIKDKSEYKLFNYNHLVMTFIIMIQHSKLFRQSTLIKLESIVNQKEKDESPLKKEEIIKQLELSAFEEKMFECIFQDAFRMAQLMTNYLKTNEIQTIMLLSFCFFMESNNIQLEEVSKNVENKSCRKQLLVLCDEIMNMMHSSSLASKKRSALIQPWLEVMVQLRTYQLSLLCGIQDTLQMENKNKSLERVMFSGMDIDNNAQTQMLSTLSEQVHKQIKTMNLNEEDNKTLEQSSSLNDLACLQIKISGRQLIALEQKMNPEGCKKKKQLGLGRGTKDFFYPEETPYQSLEDILTQPNVLCQIKKNVQSRNEERRKPKIAKGTRDSDPQQMMVKEKAFQVIREIFKKHGAVEIDTPVFELKETLTGKYGEDSKLIYDLEDQGGEMLALRYDLTVPFARYLALKNISNIKRFHIAKVYRRDQPQLNKGRFREFYQMDFDIAGSYDSMMPDAEVVKIIDEILSALNLGPYNIKLNNRKILDAMVQVSGAPIQKFATICSSIDKLDKESWENVQRELIEDKGLSLEMTNKLAVFIAIKGDPATCISLIEEQGLFGENERGQEGLQEMKSLFKYLSHLGVSSGVTFDLSLARGLDYYTGMIMEAVLQGSQAGSISGGGRYDNLVGMFASKQIPAVGASIGIERILSILELNAIKTIRNSSTEVLVATIGDGMVTHKMDVLNILWSQNIKAEMLFNVKPKPAKQLTYALQNQIPFIIWLGQDEIDSGQYKIKNMYLEQETLFKKEDLLLTLQDMISQYYQDLKDNKVIFKECKEEEEEKPQRGGRGEKKERGQKKEKK